MPTPQWTLSLENFGKIRRAEVTVAPLTILVGKNNVGKSYLASLIWGLLSPRAVLLDLLTDDIAEPLGEAVLQALNAVERSHGEASVNISQFSALTEKALNDLLRLQFSTTAKTEH
ncbi:MAG: AAA family ATPase [Rhodospirillaceae bacterium]|nr:AAA family ATPase [Rhodospirillales bacterium]